MPCMTCHHSDHSLSWPKTRRLSYWALPSIAWFGLCTLGGNIIIPLKVITNLIFHHNTCKLCFSTDCNEFCTLVDLNYLINCVCMVWSLDKSFSTLHCATAHAMIDATSYGRRIWNNVRTIDRAEWNRRQQKQISRCDCHILRQDYDAEHYWYQCWVLSVHKDTISCQ